MEILSRGYGCRHLLLIFLQERNVDVEKRLARYGNLLPLSALAENATSRYTHLQPRK